MLCREDFAFLPGDKGVSPLAPQGQFWASSSVSHLVCLFREAAGCRAPGLGRLIDTCCTPSGKRPLRQQVGLGHCRAVVTHLTALCLPPPPTVHTLCPLCPLRPEKPSPRRLWSLWSHWLIHPPELPGHQEAQGLLGWSQGGQALSITSTLGFLWLIMATPNLSFLSTHAVVTTALQVRPALSWFALISWVIGGDLTRPSESLSNKNKN